MISVVLGDQADNLRVALGLDFGVRRIPFTDTTDHLLARLRADEHGHDNRCMDVGMLAVFWPFHKIPARKRLLRIRGAAHDKQDQSKNGRFCAAFYSFRAPESL